MKREIKTKRREKSHAKQCHHKYEICLMEMIYKRIRIQLCISQMYDYMFNEEEKKRKRR